MSNNGSQTAGSARLWKVVSLVAGLLAARAARSAGDAVWKRAVGGDPPTNPRSAGTSWGAAFAWTALAGALVGLARMLSSHGAASVWERVTGALPPGLEEGPSR
jgi:hypothetical protein